MLDDIPERRTVDGVVVKPGDYVWRDRCGVRRSKVTRADMGWAWPIAYEGQCYASERACIEAAIAQADKDAKRAARDLKRERAYAERLRARLREIGAER